MVHSKSEEEKAFWQDKRNLNFWLLGATKLLSMLDAYVDAQLSDFDESPSLTLRPNLSPAATSQQAALSYGVSFKVRF
ncbi:MAG: hypothetical protein D6814_13605 [Calditrichaeota bacterium]|nr:MAG: hypothetical protein D6814_13605 [Calditrichota bacterium]